MNEWLRIMLEEIRRKRAESDQSLREHERREQEGVDEEADPGRWPQRDPGHR